MKVLVVGGGGREHALVWALKASAVVSAVICAPGNGGIEKLVPCFPLDAADGRAVLALARAEGVDFVVIGPEAPLVAGVADVLEEAGIKVFGPGAAAARLEGSKGYMKDLCARQGIPSAGYGRFADREAALAYLQDHAVPLVVKADGLAAGKGVVIAQTRDEAETAVHACFSGHFGAAGAEVVIEEFLEGEEASFFALSDGIHVIPFGSAQDHKRAYDGDQGPNTGGMGALSPSPLVTSELVEEVMDRIIVPTVTALAAEGCPFKGVLYAGLMLTQDGPKLLEYNVRFGDPEAQVLMKRLASDLAPILLSVTDGTLDAQIIDWHPEPAVSVVMATQGYPGPLGRPGVIRNLPEAEKVDGVTVFHAATRARGDDFVPTGGRVLAVTGAGRTFSEARDRAYEAVDKIDWPEGFCRRDIAAKVAGR